MNRKRKVKNLEDKAPKEIETIIINWDNGKRSIEYKGLYYSDKEKLIKEHPECAKKTFIDIIWEDGKFLAENQTDPEIKRILEEFDSNY